MSDLLWMLLTLFVQSTLIIIAVEYGPGMIKDMFTETVKLFNKGKHDEA